MANPSVCCSHTPSQSYLSSRGGDYNLSFETVVMKGLAADGGLFLPEEIPAVPEWTAWKDLSYTDLAFNIFRLYISSSEISNNDLKDIVDRSYSTFRVESITPLARLQDNLYTLELFHGPSYSFKDYRYHLTVLGATSGDTGSAAIHGLRGKEDVSVFILHPKGRISPCQEDQMTTVLDSNVHNLAVKGTFDDCQNIVKTLFNDPHINQTSKLGSVNSINFSRILAQIVYYFRSYFLLVQTSPFNIGDKVKFIIPTGNYGNVLAGYLATKMGLPVDKLIVATNENDILDRFWKTGRYEKKPVYDEEAKGGLEADGVKAHTEGCKETLSPAMDILLSSNVERLMWLLAKGTEGLDDNPSKEQAGQNVSAWFQTLKDTGGFGPVPKGILEDGRRKFESDRVSDLETLETIALCYKEMGYVLDPHTAVGVTAAKRSISRTGSQMPHISMSTAHPAKFSHAVQLALKDEDTFDFKNVLPPELRRLSQMEKRVTIVDNSWEKVKEMIKNRMTIDTEIQSRD
ncbi:MAG: hypothetical protein LQ348_004912 [Seirophora lacunosa]|nr:MAG: hypothetical protein LQ348_004912 [Seirophora lacunosa]